jgi:putative transposase
MSKPTRLQQAGTFFITAACWNRRRLFQVDSIAELFLSCVERNRSHFLLHAFVVMPDHFHLLITPKELPLERVVQYIRGGFSRAYGLTTGSKSEVWQRGFSDVRIRNYADYLTHIQYIRQNPVVRRLVETAEEYRWSSAAGTWRLDELPQGLKPHFS